MKGLKYKMEHILQEEKIYEYRKRFCDDDARVWNYRLKKRISLAE